jgi:16S rRNA (guanine1207-N2)-methyltransferase
VTFSLDTLRRRPDLEAPELQAWDAADTLLLDEAAPLLPDRDVVVIGDGYGALTLGALDRGARAVRVHQDALAGELALGLNGADRADAFRSLPLGPELLSGATLVLLRLPRALDALERLAALIAVHADPSVVVIAGGRLKHMSLGMNAVLERSFGRLDVSLARQKSRLLIARDPRGAAVEVPDPVRRRHDDLGAGVGSLEAVAVGGVFAGGAVDIGTRRLLAVLAQLPRVDRAIDLGCGTGLLAAALKRLQPDARVLASDQSWAAVESARLTMAANGLDVDVTRDDALAAEPDASADLVLLNPPFHSGAAVHGEVATRLFEAAARVLKPGGELWSVWNSSLGYRPRLERLVGETRQIDRTPKFTVTASRRR